MSPAPGPLLGGGCAPAGPGPALAVVPGLAPRRRPTPRRTPSARKSSHQGTPEADQVVLRTPGSRPLALGGGGRGRGPRPPVGPTGAVRGRRRTRGPFATWRHGSLGRPHRAGCVARIPVAASERVGQQQVRLLDGQEPRLVAVRTVGVVALGQPSVGGLDLVVGRAPGHAELPVWVLAASHAAHGRRRYPSSEIGASWKSAIVSAMTSPPADRVTGRCCAASALRARSSSTPIWPSASMVTARLARAKPSPSSMRTARPDGGTARAASPRQDADAAQPLGAALGHDLALELLHQQRVQRARRCRRPSPATPVIASRTRVSAGAIADRTGSAAEAWIGEQRVRAGDVDERECVRAPGRSRPSRRRARRHGRRTRVRPRSGPRAGWGARAGRNPRGTSPRSG